MRTRTLLATMVAAGGALLGSAPDASASHFRYGVLQWAPTANTNEVRFDLRMALRRNSTAYGSFPGGVDQFAETGDVISEGQGQTRINFGDGAVTGILQFVVTDFSVAENWIVVQALNPGTNTPGVLHAYANGDQRVASLSNGFQTACCRLGSSELANRADFNYPLETIVRPGAGNRSPVSSMVPVIIVPQSATATFLVPAADPDGDPIRWRLSTDAEAGGPSHPSGLTVNSATGQVTWNNLGLTQARFFTTQIVVEDLDANGVVKTKTPVDFLLRIVPASGVAPSCAVNPAGPQTVPAGAAVSFTVTGTDPDANEVLILNSTGVPVGATTTPSLPTSGPTGVSSVVNWTPTAAQEGSHVIAFSATDRAGQQGTCSTTINVITNRPPTISCPGPVTAQCTGPNGAERTLTVHVEDPDGDGLTVTWIVDGTSVEVDTVPPSGPPTSANVSLTRTFAVGAHTVQAVVSDGEAAAVSCQTSVTVVDNTPPVVTCNVASSMLWPPNHDMINVGLVATSSDTCSPGGGTVTVNVFGDEDDEMPTGDGHHAPDASHIASGTLRLRSERRGDADGRVYLIRARATDGGGNAGHQCCTVVIPQNMSRPSKQSVLAQAVAAQAVCQATGAPPAGYFVIGDGPQAGPKRGGSRK